MKRRIGKVEVRNWRRRVETINNAMKRRRHRKMTEIRKTARKRRKRRREGLGELR